MPTSSMLLVRNLSVVRYLLSAVVVVATSLMILSPVAARAGVRRLLTGSYFGVSSLETNAKQVAAAEAAHAARSGSVRTLGRAVFGIGLAIDTSLACSQVRGDACCGRRRCCQRWDRRGWGVCRGTSLWSRSSTLLRCRSGGRLWGGLCGQQLLRPGRSR